MAGHGSSTRTSDVLLSDVAERNLPVLFEHRRAPAANRMSGFPPKDWDAFVAHWSEVLADEGVTRRTVLVDGHVAGNVVSFEQDGEREVGYWIGGELWGKGVATEALSRFLSHAEARHPPPREGRRAQRRLRARPREVRLRLSRPRGRGVCSSVAGGLSERYAPTRATSEIHHPPLDYHWPRG